MSIQTNLSGKDLSQSWGRSPDDPKRKARRHHRSQVEVLWQTLLGDRDHATWSPPIVSKNATPSEDTKSEKPPTAEEIIELHRQTFAPDALTVSARRGLLACAIALVVALWLLTGEDDPRQPNHSEVLEHLGLQIQPP